MRGLWSSTPFRVRFVRSLERHLATLDYSVEALVQTNRAGNARLWFEDTTTVAWVHFPASDNVISSPIPSVRILRDVGNKQAMVEIPRYQEFTSAALGLIHAGVHFRQIASNDLIVISAIAPNGWMSSIPNCSCFWLSPC